MTELELPNKLKLREREVKRVIGELGLTSAKTIEPKIR